MKRPVSLFLIALVAVTLLYGLVVFGTALAAPATGTPSSGTIVKIGQDAYVAPGQVVDGVVAIGGDAVIAGRVNDSLVVIGGDAIIRPTGVLGAGVNPSDLVLVTIGGHATRQTGATVIGKTFDLSATRVGDAVDAIFAGPSVLPFAHHSAVGWLVALIIYTVITLVVVRFMPRQIDRVTARIEKAMLPSLGWGILVAAVIVPVVSIVLLVSVVGILVLVPWLAVVVPLLSLFGVICVAAVLGERVLEVLDERKNIALASVVGVVLLSLIQLVPFAGALVAGIVWIIGLGATFGALLDWRRDRRKPAGTQSQVAGPAPLAS